MLSLPRDTSNELSPVSADELLARFIFQSNHIRGDHSVKQNAFIPYPRPNLSVTRHLGLAQSELWEIGQEMAESRPATLYGRADVLARLVTTRFLNVVPTATPRNHANITGWPPDKPSQKIIAQEIAAGAQFVPSP